MKKSLLVRFLILISVGIGYLNASQNIVIDENNLVKLNKVLKKLIEENKILKQEIDKVRQYCNDNNELSSKKEDSNNEENRKYIVTAWQLNLRDKPTYENSKILRTLSIGDVIEIDSSELFNNVWLKTKENFYLHKNFIKEIKEEILQTDTQANIRSKPIENEESFIIEISKGVVLKSIGELTNWYILENGTFINKIYVRELK